VSAAQQAGERRPRVLVINVNPEAATRNGTRRIARAFERLARRLEGPEASPAFVVHVRHYASLTGQGIDLLDPAAIILGPQGVPFDAYPDGACAHLFRLIAALADSGRPLLAICGGHQALVLSHGGTIAPVHGGQATGSYDGHQKETGRRYVRRVSTGCLVGAALDDEFIVSHVEGVLELPSCFELVGQGDPCRVQAVRLRGKPVWGLQFHPERSPEGTKVLFAFLAEAGLVTADTALG